MSDCFCSKFLRPGVHACASAARLPAMGDTDRQARRDSLMASMIEPHMKLRDAAPDLLAVLRDLLTLEDHTTRRDGEHYAHGKCARCIMEAKARALIERLGG